MYLSLSSCFCFHFEDRTYKTSRVSITHTPVDCRHKLGAGSEVHGAECETEESEVSWHESPYFARCEHILLERVHEFDQIFLHFNIVFARLPQREHDYIDVSSPTSNNNLILQKKGENIVKNRNRKPHRTASD
jgi:hypothetical protein